MFVHSTILSDGVMVISILSFSSKKALFFNTLKQILSFIANESQYDSSGSVCGLHNPITKSASVKPPYLAELSVGGFHLGSCLFVWCSTNTRISSCFAQSFSWVACDSTPTNPSPDAFAPPNNSK